MDSLSANDGLLALGNGPMKQHRKRFALVEITKIATAYWILQHEL